jgi:hypothetical protein
MLTLIPRLERVFFRGRFIELLMFKTAHTCSVLSYDL